MTYSTKTCASCPAEIIWCQSATTKRPMPVDAAPSDKGNICITAGEGGVGRVAHVLAGDDLAEARARNAPLHINHFATCPRADRHRPAKVNIVLDPTSDEEPRQGAAAAAAAAQQVRLDILEAPLRGEGPGKR